MYYFNFTIIYHVLYTIYFLLLFTTSAVAEKSIPSEQKKEIITAKVNEESSSVVSSNPSIHLLDTQLTIKGNSIQLPCTGHTFIEHKKKIYVSCGTMGIVLVTIDTKGHSHISAQQHLGGTVTGFFVVDDQVWAKISRVEARPISNRFNESSSTSTVVTITPTKENGKTQNETPLLSQGPTTLGKVISVRPDSIVISLGQKEGVKTGSFIELFSQVEVDLGDGERTTRNKPLAIGIVKVVSKNRSVVKLGLGESAPKGSLARITKKRPTHNRNFPPRSANYWEVIANFRPFLALGTLGFGTIADGSIGYRGAAGFHIMFLLEPLGFAFAEEGNVISSALGLVAGYDTQAFEVGLGLGMAAINDDIESPSLAAASKEGSTVESRPPTFERVRSGLSIMQTIRLGALDGLHLNAHNMFIFHENEFQFGGVNIRFQLPLSNRSWLVVRGGGGVSGYGYGEIALRVLVKGNGEQGSLFLTPSLGGGGVFGETEKNTPTNECYSYIEDSKCIERVSYSGPMIGIGVEWRL